MKTLLLLMALQMLSVADDCQDIETKVDKFSGSTKYYTPAKYYVCYSKTIEKTDTYYYVRLQTLGATLNFGMKGVIILLEDGSKLEFPDEDVDYSEMVDVGGSYYYRYKAFIALSKEDVQKLCKSNMTDFQLYIYDGAVKGKHKELFRNYINCLAKP